jgi:hypothetical protein
VITTSRADDAGDGPDGGRAVAVERGGADGDLVGGAGRVRFRFVPFAGPAPGHHTGAEYL